MASEFVSPSFSDLPVQIPGTFEQLLTFFGRYREFDRVSDDCALDGRYFWKVLAPYSGLIKSDMYIRINDLNMGDRVSNAMGGDSHKNGHDEIVISPIAFDYPELVSNMCASLKIIKLIVDISDDPSDNNGSVHSNLIVVDDDKKMIYRFEPMYEIRYTDRINKVLEDYFKGLLPEYKFEMLQEHPQLPITETCPRKGMCAAYTLKRAMMFILDIDQALNRDPAREEELILRFAEAIKEEYGELDRDFDDSDDEYGRGRSRGRGRGGGWGGAFRGSALPFLGAVGGSRYFFQVGNPYAPIATPGQYPGMHMYSAPYYGYTFGPRAYRSPGWGWSRARWGQYGSDEYGCGCGGKGRDTRGDHKKPAVAGNYYYDLK